MKTLIFLILSVTLISFKPIKPKLKEPVATCYGNNPCAACSNCSHCKHCGAGGSCGVCSAKTTSNIKSLTSNKSISTKTANYVGQCKATTQKGSRCKRNGNGSGYCWQHSK